MTDMACKQKLSSQAQDMSESIGSHAITSPNRLLEAKRTNELGSLMLPIHDPIDQYKFKKMGDPSLGGEDGGHSGAQHRGGGIGRTRFHVALLGLTIAAVNCYAQATFCIAIVEMVLPADFVFKGESGRAVVRVLAGRETKLSERIANKDTVALEDLSCPVEYQYRDYYDSWRFSSNSSETAKQQATNQSASSHPIDMSNRFDWDASRQGLLLGAFAIGTAPLQVLGGRLAELYGAKWVLLAGCIGTALTNLTIPFLAHFSFALLILNRITMGVAQAGMEPGLMCLLAEWLAPDETGFFISMLLFAICIGFFLGSLCSSFLLTLGYGWQLTYYVAGCLNLIVALVWLAYASSRPADSKLISKEELEYIETKQRLDGKAASNLTRNDDLDTGNLKSNISPNEALSLVKIEQNLTCLQAKGKSTMDSGPRECKRELNSGNGEGQAPWSNILTTRPVWAFIVCKISIRWCADVLSIELPTYLANVLHLSIKLNGILNSVSSALFAIFSFVTGWLVNEMLKSRHLEQEDEITGGNGLQRSGGFRISKTNLRKFMQSLASFGSAICVFLMTHYDCNILFSMSMLLMLSCCLVMGTGGELQIPYDMTSRYPGTLHGIACTLSVSGWLAPPLIGLILGDQPSSRYRWSIVWYLTAVINLVGGLVFVLFADASPRDFDRANYNKSQRGPAGPGCQDERRAMGSGVGRLQLTGYHNLACNKSDTSPKQVERKIGPTRQNNSDKKHEDLSAYLYFDRELIRCRQMEGSLIMPGYLRDLDSMNARTLIFPYRTREQDDEVRGKVSPVCCNRSSSDGGQMESRGSIWRLWPLVRCRKRKFSFHEAKQIQSSGWSPLEKLFIHRDHGADNPINGSRAEKGRQRYLRAPLVAAEAQPSLGLLQKEAAKTITHF